MNLEKAIKEIEAERDRKETEYHEYAVSDAKYSDSCAERVTGLNYALDVLKKVEVEFALGADKIYVTYQGYDNSNGKKTAGIFEYDNVSEAATEFAMAVDGAAQSAIGLGATSVIETDEDGYGRPMPLDWFNGYVGLEFDKLYPQTKKEGE